MYLWGCLRVCAFQSRNREAFHFKDTRSQRRRRRFYSIPTFANAFGACSFGVAFGVSTPQKATASAKAWDLRGI